MSRHLNLALNVQWNWQADKDKRAIQQAAFWAGGDEVLVLYGWDCHDLTALRANSGHVGRTMKPVLPWRNAFICIYKSAVDQTNSLLYLLCWGEIHVLRISDGTYMRALHVSFSATTFAVDEERDFLFVSGPNLEHARVDQVSVLRASSAAFIFTVILPTDGGGWDDEYNRTRQIDIAAAAPSVGKLFVAVRRARGTRLFLVNYRNDIRRSAAQNIASFDHSEDENLSMAAASDGSVAYVVIRNANSHKTTLWMVRASDGRKLCCVNFARYLRWISVTPTSLLVDEHGRAVVSLQLPAQQPWQPDAYVHALFDEDDGARRGGGSGFHRTVQTVLTVTVAATSSGRGRAGLSRLPLELLCTLLAHLAPIVLVEAQ